MERTGTAVFGGSFDPVHYGHINVVRSLLQDENADVGRIIIMPAAVNPFKVGMKRSPDKARLEMCKLAFGDIAGCEISDFEISKGGPSYTVETLEHLKKKHDRLVFTVGSDSLETLPKWYRYEDIIKLADIAAVSRSDDDSDRIEGLADIVRQDGGKVFVIKARPFDISSTEIRKKILNSEDISCYIPENVVEYIMCEKLYI